MRISVALPRLRSPAAAPAASAAASAERASHGRLPALSIRWRLTLWYTVVLALTLAVFSLVLYWWLGHSLMRDIDALSHERALQVEERLVRYVRGQEAAMRGILDPAQYLQLSEQGVLVDSLDPFQTPGVLVRVWNSQVQVFDASRELRGGEDLKLVDYQPIVTALQGKVHRYVMETQEGHFYSYSYPTLFVNGRPLAVVQILTSLQPYHRAMDSLTGVLVGGTFLVTLIALATGAVLAQTALRSIETITRTARQINQTEHLGRRIPVNGPNDEIGRLTETINQMLDRIEAMFDRQRQFMADVSHELRTPLTTIRGEVELMRRSGSVDAEGLEAVGAEAERMSRLVGDLLLLSRTDRERDFGRAPVDLGGLMVEVHRQAQVLAREDRSVALEHVEPCIVRGDADKLRQLVLNLVQNALTHTPPGTHVAMSLRLDDGEARIVVADDGQGIPPEDLAHVFERFYRVDKARSRKGGGTGLGLAIVDWIAAAHGGSVTARSTPGAGTTFTVRLPALIDPEVGTDDDGDELAVRVGDGVESSDERGGRSI